MLEELFSGRVETPGGGHVDLWLPAGGGDRRGPDDGGAVPPGGGDGDDEKETP